VGYGAAIGTVMLAILMVYFIIYIRIYEKRVGA
jgi:ABC-type sugar transport system permease subunit